MKDRIQLLFFFLPALLMVGSIAYDCDCTDLELDRPKQEYELAIHQRDLANAGVQANHIAQVYEKRKDKSNYWKWKRRAEDILMEARLILLKENYIQEREVGRSGQLEALDIAEIYRENKDYDNYVTWMKRAGRDPEWKMVK